MYVALIDSILKHRPVNLGYTIIRTMLSILKLIIRSLPCGHFITRILKHFWVPINEPSFKDSKSIGDEAICALGFEWRNRAWVKFTDNKYIFLAPSDDRPLNDVVHTDPLPDFLLSFQGQRIRRVPPVYPVSDEITLQQVIDEVRILFVQQINFQ